MSASSSDARPDLASPHRALVLIVEDEPRVLQFVRASVEAQGFRTIECGSGRAALRDARDHVPDLVLLDLGLPDVDGIEVVRGIRAWSRVPILVLSARGQESDKVAALDAGADDYLTKPFGVGELLARMRVALRHAARGTTRDVDAPFECGPLRVDLVARRVHVDGNEVKLTPIEFRLLAVLVRHAGKVVTHRVLLQDVWGPHSVEQKQYLRVYMTHLRRKLRSTHDVVPVFETEAGVGYRLRWEPH